MKIWSGTGALAVILILSGCNEQPLTNVEYDTEAHFTGLKTYRWMDDSRRVTADREVPAAEVSARVVLAVDKALAAKGFVLAGAGKPDFVVGHHVGLRGRLDVRSMNAYYDYPPGWAWDHYRPGRELDPKETEQPKMALQNYGCVVVDVAVPADGRLIWRGTAHAVVPKGRETKVDQEWFDRSAEHLFSDFPPAQ